MKWWQFFLLVSAIYGAPQVNPWMGIGLSFLFLAFALIALRRDE